MIEIRRTFNKDRGFKLVETLNGYTFTPETNAHTFFIECVGKVNGLETVVPFEAGSTVSARFLKTNHVTELVEGSLNTDGAAVVTLPSECYSVPGRFLLTILVTTGSTTICVYAATGTVIAADSSTVNVSENASREIDEKIAKLNAATSNVNSAINRANNIANSLANDSANAVNAITAAGTQQRQSVNDLGDQLKDYLEDHYGETTDKVAAKANRSSVSTIKHAIGADGQLTLTDALNEPAKKMTIHLEPKQDLHGYDHPWVGGSGKNLLPLTLSELKAANTSGAWSGNNYALLGVTFQLLTDVGNNVTGIKVTGTVSGSGTNATLYLTNGYVDSSNYNGCIANGCPANGSGSTYSFRIGMGNGSWQTDQKDNGSGVTINAKSYTSLRPAITIFDGYSIASSGLIFYPMIRLATETDPTYEPYSNICPIEGFDSVEVVSTGKNLFDKNNLDQTLGYLTEPSALISNSANYRVSNWIRVNAGEKYTVSNGTTRGESPSYAWYDENRNLLQVTYHHSGGFPQTYTAPDGAYWLRESVHVSDLDTFMLEKGATASSYEPFGNAISLNLVSSAGSTVYGGTVTVNEDGSGTLVVDRVYYTGSDFDQTAYAANNGFNAYRRYQCLFPANNHDAICSMFDESTNLSFSSSNMIRAQYRIVAGNSTIYVVLPDGVSITDLKISYRIASPVSYSLTATQLQTIAGTNHIWTDGTNIDLDYYADRYVLENRTDKIMSALTPYVEETMVATRNYIAGEILSVGTNLYKTTTAIANGASLTVGTNVENTTLTTGVANGITINATPASAMSVEGGWVNVTLDKTNAEIIQAASSGKSIVKLQNYGATIICRQAEYTSYAVYFHGVSIDNSLLIYNVMVTSSSAQAALVGSVAMTR